MAIKSSCSSSEPKWLLDNIVPKLFPFLLQILLLIGKPSFSTGKVYFSTFRYALDQNVPGSSASVFTGNIGLVCLGTYGDVIMGMVASQITSLTIVYSTIWLDADQRKHQNCALLAFVRGIHRWLVNSPHKWAVTRKIFPFDDVIVVCKQNKYNAIWISGDHCLQQILQTSPWHARKRIMRLRCLLSSTSDLRPNYFIFAERYHLILGRVIRESIVSHMLIFANVCRINTLSIESIRIHKALAWNIYFWSYEWHMCVNIEDRLVAFTWQTITRTNDNLVHLQSISQIYVRFIVFFLFCRALLLSHNHLIVDSCDAFTIFIKVASTVLVISYDFRMSVQ